MALTMLSESLTLYTGGIVCLINLLLGPPPILSNGRHHPSSRCGSISPELLYDLFTCGSLGNSLGDLLRLYLTDIKRHCHWTPSSQNRHSTQTVLSGHGSRRSKGVRSSSFSYRLDIDRDWLDDFCDPDDFRHCIRFPEQLCPRRW